MALSSGSKELIDKLSPIEIKEDGYDKSGSHLELKIEPGMVTPAAQLMKDREYILEDLTAIDHSSHREMVYRYNTYTGPDRITIRADLGSDDQVDSISEIFPGALWMERECWEFLGVNFAGHPELRNLLLPEDAGFHPLRKDFVIPAEYQEPEYKQD